MVIIVNFVPEIYSIIFYSGTNVVGAVHYCIYLVYFACELRPSGSPQPVRILLYFFLAYVYFKVMNIIEDLYTVFVWVIIAFVVNAY